MNTFLIEVSWSRFLYLVAGAALGLATLAAAHVVTADYFVVGTFGAMSYALARATEAH